MDRGRPAGRASAVVRTYLLEHPSIRSALALGVLNDAAAARRIRAESPERLSFEAIAVALRRAERRDPTDESLRAGPVLAAGGSLGLRTGYTMVRFTDSEAALRAYLERPTNEPRTGPSFLQVEESHRYISLACPEAEAAAVVRILPAGTQRSVTHGLALVRLEVSLAAHETPGVIAFLAERLGERGLLPRLLAAALAEVAIVTPEAEARETFAFLHALRRDPGGERSKPSSAPGPLAEEEEPVPRRRENDPGTGAELARAYIAGHPSIADCLGYGLVNFTALARRIAAEVQYDSPGAIEAALRRYRPTGRPSPSVEQRILAVVRQSRLEVRTRVALVTAPPTWELLGRLARAQPNSLADRRRLFQVLQSPTSVTVLCDEDLVEPVLRAMGPRLSVDASRHLAAVVVHSPEAILETPGVLAYLSGAIYRAGLNCLELMSLHRESTFVVRQTDALEAFGVLSDLVHPVPPGGEPAGGAGAGA